MSSTFPERYRRRPMSTAVRGPQPHDGAASLRRRARSARPSGRTPRRRVPPKTRHIIDRWDGALGLLVLRIVVAAIFAIRGLQKVQHLDVTRTQFAQIGIPYADTMAFVVGVCEVAIAIALIFGIAMRIVGLGIAVIAIGALVYVKWRTNTIFTDGQPGLRGRAGAPAGRSGPDVRRRGRWRLDGRPAVPATLRSSTRRPRLGFLGVSEGSRYAG